MVSVITAIDTRHPVTNPLFIRACCDLVAWTGDVGFLRRVIGPMRRALSFALDELDVRRGKHVFVPWVGHDGRSGIAFDAAAGKTMRPGHGVGNNSWDLLPFGAHDALATVCLHDALRAFADLERRVAAHPEWEIPAAVPPHDPVARDDLAAADGLRDPLPRSAAHRHRPRRRARRRRRHGRGRRWCGPLTPFTGACAR